MRIHKGGCAVLRGAACSCGRAAGQVAARRPVSTPAADGFTLPEMMIAMTVVAVILSGVVGLAYALSNYHNEGEAEVVLATNGRFAQTMLGKDIRCAQAACVSTSGGLVLWMGDGDGNGRMDVGEFVVYYKPNRDKVIRRMSFSGGASSVGTISPATLSQVTQSFDGGMLSILATSLGATVANDAVCTQVASLAFYANRAAPQTAMVEYVFRLSRAQNVTANTGQTISMTIYGTGAMLVPYAKDGFNPTY